MTEWFSDYPEIHSAPHRGWFRLRDGLFYVNINHTSMNR